MDKKRWDEISRIFDLALTMPADRRTTYIRQLCADDPELQEEINELLDSVEESEGMLEQHLKNNEVLINEFATVIDKSIPEMSSDLTGSTIDKWKLTELLGRGGMASVYKAIKVDSEIQQTGALKIMHQNLNTPENVQRFRLEQQILAGLQHPHIASLIEGGVSDDGLPYLVMEYVEGKSLIDYCDGHQLTIKARLKLFGTVCETVQYAHRNLIVHRDLKPENILVTRDGHVKILDFGIAKLLDPDQYTFAAVQTRQNQRLMSLDYAAPEQISGEAVTTATDLYSLGILLYELLSGVHPFDFENKSYRTIAQTVRETVPPSPSRRLSSLGDPELLSVINESHSSQDFGLPGALRGDLDAIVLKALRKKPDDRYTSPDQLMDDIDRFLQDKPVLARGEAARYRVKKFFKRYKKGIGIASTFILVLVVLVSFYTYRLAEERNTARFEANKAEQVKNLLIEIFQSGDPFSESNATDLTVREVLDRGTERVVSELEQQPLVQAELMEALGNVYIGLVRYSEAEPLLRQALTTYQDELGSDHPNVAGTAHILGYLLLRKGNYDEAESLFESSREIYLARYGEEDPSYAYALKMLGFLYSETGRTEEALRLYRSAVDIYESANSPAIAGALNDMGYLLKDVGRFDEAVATLNRCIDILNQHYENPEAAEANALSGIAQVMHRKGNIAEAEKRYRQVLKIRKEIFPVGHTYIAASQLRLGWVLVEQGRITEAVPLVQAAKQSFENHLPSGHWKIAAAKGIIALAWIGQGRFEQAEKTLLNTFQVFKSQFGSHDWRTISTLKTLVKLYQAWNKPQKVKTYVSQLKE